jgi:dephospho-CoA kinase
MLLIGLTGGIGAGKSSVAARLVARGAFVIDGDLIAREVVQPGGLAYDAVVARFGTGVLADDGTLNRPALAAIVFNDKAALADLNAITHPAVAQTMLDRVAAHAGTDDIVVLDIPLLAEGGRERWSLQGIIVVDTPVDVAVRRLVEHRGFGEDDARARIANQASREERRAIADVVIDNTGTPEQLDAEVDRVWAWLESLRAG